MKEPSVSARAREKPMETVSWGPRFQQREKTLRGGVLVTTAASVSNRSTNLVNWKVHSGSLSLPSFEVWECCSNLPCSYQMDFYWKHHCHCLKNRWWQMRDWVLFQFCIWAQGRNWYWLHYKGVCLSEGYTSRPLLVTSLMASLFYPFLS